jgi:hypothetical protein
MNEVQQRHRPPQEQLMIGDLTRSVERVLDVYSAVPVAMADGSSTRTVLSPVQTGNEVCETTSSDGVKSFMLTSSSHVLKTVAWEAGAAEVVVKTDEADAGTRTDVEGSGVVISWASELVRTRFPLEQKRPPTWRDTLWSFLGRLSINRNSRHQT